MAKDVIIACDFPSADACLEFLDKFGDLRPYVKIGMELYYAEGPEMVRRLKERGHKVFLDLKLHDIPNTVKSAMKVLASLGVDMCNVHAGGSSAMMRGAIEGLEAGIKPGQSRPLLIAVTMLTSISEEVMRDELRISGEVKDTVAAYAKNAANSGLDGVVCSPLEASAVKASCGEEFLTVTPGVRYPDGDIGDQQRVTTPARAREMGSDYIVVGRPITRAEDPAAAYVRFMNDFVGGIN